MISSTLLTIIGTSLQKIQAPEKILSSDEIKREANEKIDLLVEEVNKNRAVIEKHETKNNLILRKDKFKTDVKMNH